MEEVATYSSQSSSNPEMRLLDLEEKQRLVRERVLLLGKNFIDDKDKTLQDIQEIKRTLILLKEEVLRMKEFSQRIAEQLDKTARKDELLIIQKQLDLLRK
jgi:hypothetical protein